ncbi:unnamed protein product [Amaranthus hypochondriacus]
MASGKVSVSRRGDFTHVSRRIFDYNDDSSFGAKIRSDSENYVRSEYGSRKKGLFDNDIEVKVEDSFQVDGGIQKKRKLSPVVWQEKAMNSDDDDQEPGQLDEEDFTHAPNILTSRWAYDDDDRDMSGVVKKGEDAKVIRSSPHSVLTRKESSDVSGVRSSGSDGGCLLRVHNEDECFESDLKRDDCMEVDASDGEDCAASDDGGEPGVSGRGNRNMLQGCRSVFKYKKLNKISEGSYGIVYKARDEESGEIVALKKMKLGDQREGFPIYYLREINTLVSLNHPSIVNVREVVVDDSPDGFDSIYMVMDHVEHDLKALMQTRKQPFRYSEVKYFMLQLLEGVKYLHHNWVLHRDLKTSNLLVNNKGELKICDFGMARQYGSPLNPYTALVVTLWYRAPELLLGATEYSTAVDMWSVGCIMAELLANKPLFDGKTEIEQLNKMFATLGTPNDKIWPGFSQLPGHKFNFIHQPYNQLHKKFPRTSFTGAPALSDTGLDLLSRLLTYDPEKRITAEEALDHPWFKEVPLPNSREFVPTFSEDKDFN